MRNPTDTEAPRANRPELESFPQAIELTPELIAHHIQLGRQLRAEAFGQMVRGIGAAFAGLFDRPRREGRVPSLTVPR